LERTEQTPDVLRAAIFGCGWFGRVHLERLTAIPGIQVVALADPDLEAAGKLAASASPSVLPPGQPMAVYAEYEELLSKEALDFVVIASPNRLHVEQLLAALSYNLHVLCEKPLSMSPPEVESVVEAWKQSGKIVAIAYQSRYRRSSRLLRRLLHSGEVGAVTSIAVYNQEDWITPNVGTWRHDPMRCPGGFFADANGHQLDNLFWMTGLEPIWVRATTDTRGTGVPIVTCGEARLRSQGRVNVTLPGGVPMTFMFVGDAHTWREEIAITTERADFIIRNGELFWVRDSTGLKAVTTEDYGPEILSAPSVPDEAFVAALRGDRAVLTRPNTVWPVLRFTLAGLESAGATGEPVHVA
jgi:predicted dehydrogenase